MYQKRVAVQALPSLTKGVPSLFCDLVLLADEGVVSFAPAHDDTQKKMGGNVVYQPPSTSIRAYLEQTKRVPGVIIVGAHHVGRTEFEFWRHRLTCERPHVNPVLIRRGTGLSNIHLKAAKELGIEVINTPQINTPHVVSFILNELNLPAVAGLSVAVVGYGAIGKMLVQRLQDRGYGVGVYSQKDPQYQGRNLEDILTAAAYIVVCCSSRADTVGMIRSSHIGLLASGAKLVVVSEPEIFSEDALYALHHRKDLEVTFDNSPIVLNVLKQKLSQDSRSNVVLSSKAVASEACNRDLDLAVMATLAKRCLPKVIERALQKETLAKKRLLIVGGGVQGLVLTYLFQKMGHDVKVANGGKGTTDTANMRHVSFTEGLPFLHEGYHLLDTFTEADRGWLTGLHGFASGPLAGIFKEFVAELNKQGVRLWQLLQEMDPELFRNVRMSPTVVRLILNSKDTSTFAFQQKVHQDEALVLLSKDDLVALSPGLRPLIESGRIYQAFKVPGFAFDILEFVKNIKQRIGQNGGEVVDQWIEGDGVYAKFDHVIKATGAFQNDLSVDVACEWGLFYTLPDPGISVAVKVHPDVKDVGHTGVLNCWSAEDGRMLVSGGLGFSGHQNTLDLGSDLVKGFIKKMDETVRSLFPVEFEQASRQGSLNRKLCPRPTAWNGIPIVEMGQAVTYVSGTGAAGTVESFLLGLVVRALVG